MKFPIQIAHATSVILVDAENEVVAYSEIVRRANAFDELLAVINEFLEVQGGNAQKQYDALHAISTKFSEPKT